MGSAMLGLNSPFGLRGPFPARSGGWTPTALFANGEIGVWYSPSNLSTMFTDTAGTTSVTASGDVVARMDDRSGNGLDALQATYAHRPTYEVDPDRLALDRVDDRLIVDLPAITGTMVLATPEGTAAYSVNISAGDYDIGGRQGSYFPGSAIVGQVIRDGELTQNETRNTIAYMRKNGGGNDYAGVTNFGSFWLDWAEITVFPTLDTSNGTNFQGSWQNCTSLTSFPLIDTSNGTNFINTWYGCSSLTSFPLIDTSSGTSFVYTWYGCSSLTSFPLIDTSSGTSFFAAWFGCSSLTSFPLIDTSSGTNFLAAWQGCSSLTSFPSAAFDGCLCTNFTKSFINTNLSETSIDNILVSINSNGTSGGTFDQSRGSAPSATGEAAITALRSRGWTVTVTGGY